MSSQIRFSVFQYDIPDQVDFPNPTGYLRRRNNHGKVFAFKTQYSMWLVDRDNPPLALQAKMEAAGCTVDLYPLDPEFNEQYLARAATQMSRDLDAAKKKQEVALKKADDKLAEAEQQFNDGVIGWDRLVKARKDHATHRKNALGRLEQLVKDLEAACKQFGIAAPEKHFSKARARVQGIRALGSRRAELYVELADAIKGTAMETAAKDAEVPVGILADYAEENGIAPETVAKVRETFTEPEKAPAPAAAATAPKTFRNAAGVLVVPSDYPGMHWDAKVKQFDVDCSQIGLKGAPAVINIRSHKTGNIATFARKDIQRNAEGDILWVDYLAQGGLVLRLHND